MNYPMRKQYDYNYDYTKCMVMKLKIAQPEKNGCGSHVEMTFAQALDAIKKIDAITQGVQKIYYLVGWQYDGHDDKYPDFFEVNRALKRAEDKTALDSFLWLYEGAKQYNSVVSVHINFNDAYGNAPSFDKFVKAGALVRNKKGQPWAIENYNHKPCYKTDLKAYWETGLFAKMFDRLLTVLPLQECRTVHVDNFQCYHSHQPEVTIAEMMDARAKMIDYVKEKGIDITSEFTYKEDETLPNKKLLGLPREHDPKMHMDTLGMIPVSWWCTRMTREEYLTIPPQLYGGGLYKDKRYSNYLYGNMHGEDIVKVQNPDWPAAFLHEFATVQVPYHFLCQHQRLAIEGRGSNERCVFDGNLVSYNKNQKITCGQIVMKEKDTLLLPLVHKQNQYLAYSKEGDSRSWQLTQQGAVSATLSHITPQGNVLFKEVPVKDNLLPLTLGKKEGLLVELHFN